MGHHRHCRVGNDYNQRYGLSIDSIQATELLIEALRRRHNPRADLLAAILAGARDECQRDTQPLIRPLSPSGAPGHTDTPD